MEAGGVIAEGVGEDVDAEEGAVFGVGDGTGRGRGGTPRLGDGTEEDTGTAPKRDDVALKDCAGGEAGMRTGVADASPTEFVAGVVMPAGSRELVAGI